MFNIISLTNVKIIVKYALQFNKIHYICNEANEFFVKQKGVSKSVANSVA